MASSAAPVALYVLLAGCLALSLISDLRSRRILDVVTLPTLVLALGIRFLLVGWGGSWGLASGLLGMAIGFVAFLVPALLGGMGGGDVKLSAAVGAVVGWERIPEVLVWIAIAGGLFALAVMVCRGAVASTLRRVAELVGLRKRRDRSLPIQLPYGVAIAAGTAFALLSGSGATP